jgi:glycosyltransferase involved in cell wall biosynthesis
MSLSGKRLLFMIHDMNVGGAEVGLVDVMNILIESNQVDLVLLRKQGPLLDRLDPRIGVHCVMRSDRSPLYNRFMRLCYFSGVLTRLAYRKTVPGTYDVEMAFIEGYPAVFVTQSPNRKSVKLASIRVGLKSHPLKARSFLLGRWALRRAYEKADAIHCVSRAVRDEFLEIYPQCAHKTHSVYTYFDTASIRQKAKASSNPLDSSTVNFLAVGRFAPQKSYDSLVSAFARLHSQFPETRLHFLGDFNTPHGTEVQKLAEDLGIAGSLVFHGVDDDPYPFMKHCRALVSSSLYEGFPRVVNEALALGTLCIATDVTGSREALGDGKLGLLATNSVDGIYECMKLVMEDPAAADACLAALASFDGNRQTFFEGLAALCERKKRLIIFAPKLTIGGMERSLVNLLRNGAFQKRFDVTLFVVYKGRENLCELLPEDIRVDYACKGDWNLWGKARAAAVFLWRWGFPKRYDSAVCYSHHHPVLARLARRTGSNCTLFVHSNILRAYDNKKAAALVKGLGMPAFDHVVCVSQNAKDALAELDLKGNVEVIGNLIDGDDILNKAQECTDDYEFGNKTAFVHVSRHDEKPKAITRLLKACEKLNGEGLKFDLLLIGDGPDHGAYRQMVKALALRNVHLLGSKLNPYAYMRRADALVLCSRYEGSPTVFLEAMVLGLPIITTDVADARTEVEGKYGIVVPNEDDAIADGLREFLQNRYPPVALLDYRAFNRRIVEKLYALI